MEDYGLGYPGSGDLALRAATKPVSGEAIVTFLERMDAISEHGTKAGYEAGCRGSHCPGKESVGMSCSQASIRYAGDMSYRRRVDAGLSAEAIWAEDQAAQVVMPKVTPRVAGKQTRRRITDEERATFRRLHSEGLSTGKIAKQTGRALSVVARELGLMGLASNGHRFGAKWS
jgi:hypothetical protein